MANTGVVNYSTLDHVKLPCPGDCTVDDTKPNLVGDPNYIAPGVDTTKCPISYTTNCPALVATPTSSSIIFEFSLQNDVVLNPTLAKAKIKAMLGGVEQSSIIFDFPNSTPNYFIGILGSLSTSSIYDVELDYLNASDLVIDNCALGSYTTP